MVPGCGLGICLNLPKVKIYIWGGPQLRGWGTKPIRMAWLSAYFLRHPDSSISVGFVTDKLWSRRLLTFFTNGFFCQHRQLCICSRLFAPQPCSIECELLILPNFNTTQMPNESQTSCHLLEIKPEQKIIDIFIKEWIKNACNTSFFPRRLNHRRFSRSPFPAIISHQHLSVFYAFIHQPIFHQST